MAYTWDNVNSLTVKDPNDYYLKLYEKWKVSRDHEQLEELFFIACNVYPVLARNLPPNRMEMYDVVHVVAEIQRGYETGAASDGKRMTCQGSPVQLQDSKRAYTIHAKNSDMNHYIRAYESDKETVLKWIMEMNNVKYYRNNVVNEYDMYCGLVRGEQIPLFRVRLLEGFEKVYVVYEMSEGLTKYVKTS